MLEREKSEKEGYIQEFDETRRQLEEDVDREIEELKERYEAKLASERESALTVQRHSDGGARSTPRILKEASHGMAGKPQTPLASRVA